MNPATAGQASISSTTGGSALWADGIANGFGPRTFRELSAVAGFALAERRKDVPWNASPHDLCEIGLAAASGARLDGGAADYFAWKRGLVASRAFLVCAASAEALATTFGNGSCNDGLGYYVGGGLAAGSR
jgi:hypothetical protein